MSVIGIDFGNENCFIAVARSGGIETIANEYSQRVTPSYVAFGARQRDLGVSAKNKQNTNLKSTIYGFKRLVGRKFQEPALDPERALLPYQIVEMPDGEVGVSVQYYEEERQFSCRQITAMLFTKLKAIAEAALKIKVADCVISVPLFFGDAERRAILDASKIAGLNCLRLMNETTAVALSYGFYKNDLPEEKPRLVAFVDIGHSGLQVSIAALNKDRLKMLGCETDVIGGRDFDRVLVEYFCDDFAERYNLNVKSNKRALIRLYTECEKLKKQMSSITLELPINIECFMEDKDVTGKMKREKFEELSASLLKRIEAVLQKAVSGCPSPVEGKNVKVGDIESVEIVGGCSRLPAVKALVKKVFGREPSTTLNADEAVSRGCALQCAMLSPTFKVKDFALTDLQPFPITVRILPQLTPGKHLEYDVFPRFHQAPFSRVISVYRREPFKVEAFYRDGPFANKVINVFAINVKPTTKEPSEEDKVKVKVRVNINGIFSVVSATLIEKSEEPPKEMEAGETDPRENEATGTAPVEMDVDQVKEPSKDKEATGKKRTRQTDLPVVVEGAAKTHQEVITLCDIEASMVNADLTEQERLDAKNAVEEYVYDMRDKLAERLAPYSSAEEKEKLTVLLRQTEDWLYGEGEDLERAAYKDRLEKLHVLGQPIVERWREAEDRPRVLEQIGAMLQQVRKAIAAYRAGDDNFAHLVREEIDRLADQLDTKQAWLDETIGKINATPLHCPPCVFVAQLHEESAAFERVASAVLNKPKPTPPTVEPPKDDKVEPMNTDDTPQAPAADKKPGAAAGQADKKPAAGQADKNPGAAAGQAEKKPAAADAGQADKKPGAAAAGQADKKPAAAAGQAEKKQQADIKQPPAADKKPADDKKAAKPNSPTSRNGNANDSSKMEVE